MMLLSRTFMLQVQSLPETNMPVALSETVKTAISLVAVAVLISSAPSMGTAAMAVWWATLKTTSSLPTVSLTVL